MRRTFLLLTLVTAMVLAFSGVVLAQQVGSDPSRSSSSSSSAKDFVDGEILVKFKSGTSKAAKDEIHRQQGAQVKENLRKPDSQVAPDIQVVEVSSGDEKTKSEEYKRDRKVEYAEPNFLYQPSTTTATDADFANLYGLNNTGQTVNDVAGTADADIDAPEAWDATTGLDRTVVAVIDTGVDINHPELSGNTWTNPGESGPDSSGNDKATNGLDDDDNTFVDDVNGWDFFRNENTVYDAADGDRHDTHVAGTIAAEGNTAGVVGVNWQAQIMPLKFLGPNGGSTAHAIKALDYAVNKKAMISNNSWGGGGYSLALEDALKNADSAGHLFIAAAGNGGADKVGDNNDSYPSYPASYANPNIVSVAATDSKDALGSFSNYGATSVDLAAPGVYTYSTLPGNTYGYMSGTSMATPHVSGVAALIKSHDSNLLDSDTDLDKKIKDKLLSAVDKKGNLSGKVASGGRLNAATPLGIDVTRPTVTTTSPANGATGVAPTTSVTVTFSEAIDPASLTTTTFTLFRDGTRTPIGARVTPNPDGKSATLYPSASLASRTKYKATVTGGSGGAKDLAGNALGQDKVWTFTTKW